MRAKDSSVKFDGCHPVMLPAMFTADIVCRKILKYEMIVTSCRDGQHSEYSRHYQGCAFDLRTWTTEDSGVQIPPSDRTLLIEALQDSLGPDWNVYRHETHVHIGYKPRRKTLMV